MNPRQYDMSSRDLAREATRRRILEATLSLHTEKGIFGTSWKDIAERADVSIGTVYRHFPSLAELVPACGELLFERTSPPSPDDAVEVIGDTADPVARLEIAGTALFAFYERAWAHIDSDARERELFAAEPRGRLFVDDSQAAALRIALEPPRVGYAASLRVEVTQAGLLLQEAYRLHCVPQAGKVDRLVGLKENVILGHLVPAGTGFKTYQESEVRIRPAALEALATQKPTLAQHFPLLDTGEETKKHTPSPSTLEALLGEGKGKKE